MSAPTINELLLDLCREGLVLALLLSAPVVLAAALAGFIVSVLQAATLIGEPTLSFVPKLLAAALALAVAAPWIGDQMYTFTRALLELVPRLGHV